jgi:hypothetical protein
MSGRCSYRVDAPPGREHGLSAKVDRDSSFARKFGVGLCWHVVPGGLPPIRHLWFGYQ